MAQYGPPPGPGSRNCKPLIIGLSVAAAVVVVVVVVAAIITFSDSGASGSAGDTVKGDLAALSRGDAAAALSYSTDQPESGQSATMSAISAALADCAKSNLLSPPNCPQRAYDPDLVDGTAAWSAPDVSGVKITMFEPYHLEVLFSGQTTFALVASKRSGGSKSGPVTAFISGKADVSQKPPAVSLRRRHQLAEQALG